MSKVQGFSQGGAWNRTGNSKVRLILEKMSGTHICRERGERIRAFWAWKWALHMPLLAASLQDPRLWGQIRACSKGHASKSGDFALRKAEDQKVLAAAFHIWEGRRSQARKRLQKEPRKPETCP